MSKNSNKNGWGGKRDGAGKPKATATLIAQEFRDTLAKRIKAKADKWYDAIEDVALGHFIEVVDKDGTVKVYMKSPDPRAWQTGIDRAFGKAAQPITGDNGEIINMVAIKFIDCGEKTDKSRSVTSSENEDSVST